MIEVLKRNPSNYSQYLFISLVTVYIYLVTLPFILFNYNQDLNIKFFISLSIFLSLSFLMITNIETKIKQFIFPILIMNVPGAIDNFFPSFSADIYDSVTLPIAVISYLDLFIISFFLVKLFIYKEKIKLKFDYFKIIFILITIIYSLFFIFIHIQSQYYINAYAGILLFFRIFFLLVIIDEIYTNLNLKYFYYGFALSCILLVIDAFIYSYVFTHSPHLTHSTFANNVFGNILIFYYATYLVYFKKNSFIILALIIAMLILTGSKAATISFLVLFVLLYYSKNIVSYKQVFKYLFILFLIFMTYLFIDYITMHDYISKLSSLYTRGILWSISMDMFFDHVVQGVGYWTWNSSKYDYDFLELGVFGGYTLWEAPQLLDAHNGYLHILSEFGIIIFTLFYSIFFYVYKRINFYYFIPFFVWLLTEITNAGINKHQILIFIVFFLYLTYRTKHDT